MQRILIVMLSLVALSAGTVARMASAADTPVADRADVQQPPAEAFKQTPEQAAAQAAWEAKSGVTPAQVDTARPAATVVAPKPPAKGAAEKTSKVVQQEAVKAVPSVAPAINTGAAPRASSTAAAIAAPDGAANAAVNTPEAAAHLPAEAAAEAASNDPATNPASMAAPEAALQDVTQQLATLEKDLSILEEDLLYPPSSRVAVFVSMDVGELFALDEVEVKLNGTTVVHHLYTEQQVDALHRGGIQRLYVGNAKQGENEITAFFLGRDHRGEPLRRATSAKFAKSFEPAYVELKILDSEVHQRPDFKVEVH